LDRQALKAIEQAFATAWQEIADNFGGDAAEAARVQLMSALPSIANEESRNAQKRVALDYKDPLGAVSTLRSHPCNGKIGRRSQRSWLCQRQRPLKKR
jgi:hypothetical protein